MLIYVIEAKPIGPFKLFLRFSDGTEGERDFSDFVRKAGTMLKPLEDKNYFARVFIEHGALTWPNGLDLDPQCLHQEMRDMGLLRASAAA